MEIEHVLQWGNLLVLVGTAIWAVTKIKITTEMLSLSIGHLREAVDRLDKNCDAMRKDIGSTRDRLTILEVQNGNQPKRRAQ